MPKIKILCKKCIRKLGGSAKMAKIWKIEGLSLTLTQYIFCRSRRDKSIDGIKSEFYHLEHFLKIVKVGKN